MNLLKSPLLWTVGIAIVALLLLTGRSSERAVQPILYNHSIHVEDGGMECTDCHQYARTGARASIPNISVCVECHDEMMTESPQESLLVDYISRGRLIPWVQVNTVRDYAYFSHRRHVLIGEIECQHCHGNMGGLTSPLVEPFAASKMAWCIDCHERNEITTECYACHR